MTTRPAIAQTYTDARLLTPRNINDLFKTVSPPDIKYNQGVMGPGGERRMVEFKPEGGPDFTYADHTINFKIRSEGVLNFKNAMLEFELVFLKTNVKDYRLHTGINGIWELFNRIRVKYAGRVLLDQQEKHLLRTIIFNTCATNDLKKWSEELWGTKHFDEVVTSNLYIPVLRPFIIPLDISMLTNVDLPMANLHEIEIEFFLQDPSNVFAASINTTPGYKIVKPLILVQEVFYQHDLQMDILNLSPIYIPFTNYKVFKKHIVKDALEHSLSIPVKVQGISRVIAFFTKEKTKLEIPGEVVSVGQNCNVKSYQLKIGNNYIPNRPIEIDNYYANNGDGDSTRHSIRSYLNAIECLSRVNCSERDTTGKDNGETSWHHFNPADYTYTKYRVGDKGFVMAIDLIPYQINDENMISKFNTSLSDIPITFELKLHEMKKNALLYIYVVHSSVLTIHGKDRVEVLE